MVSENDNQYCPAFKLLECQWVSTAHGGPWSSQEAFFQASLLLASVLQFLVLKTGRSISRPSIHLRFGLPLLRMPKVKD
ncbi:hypothetical protein TNCV_2069841 [Trichonephila clavipes]|uniref:Uncharacterized protein n=1 Tax=Trichonephila clavipes TaxID=2585209 RepID=A0A8X7BE67_TRICX|nr:hypothetical protein TNCV_2069841 [Trichonephila clavipes]